MSTETQAAADLRVKFNRNLYQDGRGQSEVEMIEDEDQISDHGLQQTEKQNLQAERRNWFRVLKFSLGVFYFLILAGLMTRYLLVSLEINKMNSCSQLQTEHSVNISCLQDNIKMVETKDTKCPDRWMRFESSCYYKSTYLAPWDVSRTFCQRAGSDLVIINSVEEKDFVSKLHVNKESWIGLRIEWSSQKNEYDWIWVDGSPLAEIFRKTENLEEVTDYVTEAYLNPEGKITERFDRKSKLFTCEK